MFPLYGAGAVEKSTLRQEFLSKVSTFEQNVGQRWIENLFPKIAPFIEISDRALITFVVEVTIKVFRLCSGLIEKTFHISHFPGGATLYIQWISYANRDGINEDLE